MFDISSGTPLCDLDVETRQILARLLETRNAYYEELQKLNEMKIRLLQNPSPVLEAQISEYSSIVVAPLRRAQVKDMDSLLTTAVNVSQLKEMLPMLLMAVIGSINLPLLMTTFGVDMDHMTEIMEKTRSFIKDGIE